MAESVGKPVKKPVPPQLTPITKETAAEFCKKAASAKKLRAELRRKLLQAAVDEGVDKIFIKALKTSNTELLDLVAKASKLVGADFASSEEAVQRMQANADVKSNGKVEVVVSGLDG